MKLKDYLEALPNDYNAFDHKGICGKELKIIFNDFCIIEEFKDKKVEVIENIEIGEPNFKFENDGISLDVETTPKILTIKGLEALGNEVKIYSLFLKNNDVFVRCTEDSLIK